MKTLLLWLCIFFAYSITPAFAVGHCMSGETTYFSCSAKRNGKIISVCGGTNWLQYRFGKLGVIELEFPKERVGSLNQFTGDNRLHSGSGVSAQWLMFDRSGTEYSVTQMEGGSNFNGVSVSIPRSKRTVDLSCDPKKPSVFNLSDAIWLVPEGNP